LVGTEATPDVRPECKRTPVIRENFARMITVRTDDLTGEPDHVFSE
jgi:hypothetical protein